MVKSDQLPVDIIKKIKLECDSVVFYRLPFEDHARVVLGTCLSKENGIDDEDLNNNGFVFNPFNTQNGKCVFVNTVYEDLYSTKLIEQLKVHVDKLLKVEDTEEFVDEQSFSDYSDHFIEMHRELSEGKLDKVILSRPKLEAGIANSNIVPLFEMLCKMYPHAFVYVVNTPVSGLWIGAGPELLLQNDNNLLRTVSLAGTLPKVSNEEWGQKELDEQSLVSKYVRAKLTENGVLTYNENGPCSMVAGQVQHLRTDFSFLKKHLNCSVSDLLYQLHPTPAVCGMPKEEAKKLIDDCEKYDREYYSGFLGPVNNGAFTFFVNIRCLRLFQESAVLYVGGGLTRGSELQKEWDETELKAQTLLSVLKNMRNLQTYE